MILASTAATMGKEVEVFFTFYGIECLKKDIKKMKVSPVGNPAMALRLPFGPPALRAINWRGLPDLIWALPGMTTLATRLFHQSVAQQNQLPFDQLRHVCLDLGVRFTVCQMSMEWLGYQPEDLIEGLNFAGAATYFAHSPDNQSLFI